MQRVNAERRITALTPTMAALMQVEAPAGAADQPLAEVLRAGRRSFDGAPVRRVLAFLPDAVGVRVWQMYPDVLNPVLAHAPLRVPLRAVMPPKTPVCYASVFTGALPDYHGIRVYERPVLTCDTLFDALIRAGRRPAIVAVPNCSMSLIFREREMDYFPEPDDDAVTRRVEELLEADSHDFIAAYCGAADKEQHRTAPQGPPFEAAVRDVVRRFVHLAEVFERCVGARRALVFAPDHGGHLNPETGKGDHGLDIPEDMEVYHCFGFGAP